MGFFVSLNLSVSLRNSAGQWDCGADPLNFPESGWWGRILSAMKPLFLLALISLSYLSVSADDEGKHLFLLSG